MNNSWFVVVNPKAGNGNFKAIWNEIQQELNKNEISFSYKQTAYHKHEIELVHKAIQQGFTKIISVGGDGTLHHVINGVMTQNYIESKEITVSVIPIGTGNDWVKTYGIQPNNIEKAIVNIVNNHTVLQDIGKLETQNNQVNFFNNVAGIGYDGYVVNKLNNLKRFGPIAYLLSGVAGLLFYKKTHFTVDVNNEKIETKCLMTLFGICKYSAGGMQLTDFKKPNDGLFDITIAKNLSFFDLIFNLKGLYSGAILKHKKVVTTKTSSLLITPTKGKQPTYIQADGELINTGVVKVSMIPEAINFVIP